MVVVNSHIGARAKRVLVLLAVSTLMLSLTACMAPGPKRNATVGALTGGTLGWLFGGGAVGTIGGAAVGGAIGSMAE